MVLYAFNAEIAQVRERVREPFAGALRLQWWRDVVNGDRSPDEIASHPLAPGIRALVSDKIVPGDLLLDLLDAREREFSGQNFSDLADLENYIAATGGGLAQAAACVLGADAPTRNAAQLIGTAFGLTGQLRALPIHMSTGWLTLPEALLDAAGISADQVKAGTAPRPSIAMVAAEIGARAAALLTQARTHKTNREALAALLPALIARKALRMLARSQWDAFAADTVRPLTMPLRLMLAAALGRL